MTTWSRKRVAAAWGVHAYTAMGLPLALAQIWALQAGDVQLFWILQWTAVFVDATDGGLARAARVKDVVPAFDGRKLDDIVDFLTFSLIPALALPALGLVPYSWRWLAVVPILASGYGFCQERAKTDTSFVGFPSYWNILLFYLWILQASPVTTAVSVVALAIMVFVPLHYIYPTRAPLLKRVTITAGYLWGFAILAAAAWPTASWARPLAWASIAYPVYYVVLSGYHHRQITRRAVH